MSTLASKSKVLVVEDEASMRELVSRILGSAGYSVRSAADGHEGLRTLFAWQPDLVVLDIQMPTMDGWEVLRRIREVSEIPVIMLTALGREDEKVKGLRSGADDYVVKPISKGEFLARVEAIFRRAPSTSGSGNENAYRDSVLFMDFENHQVSVDGLRVEFSPIEFRMLAALVKNARAVLSPDRLLDLCWGERSGGPGSVRVYINSLRKKIEKNPARPQLIETVREFGYRYQPPPIDA